MKKLQLHPEDSELQPGDLVGIGYGGGPGRINVAMFVATYYSAEGNQVVRYYVLGSPWHQKKLKSEQCNKRWVWLHSSFIHGDYLQSRLIRASEKNLTDKTKQEYYLLKSLLQNEH
mgnify:CR=1 FL=1|tara:strand:+ start:13287 stop:13634 length:348 start_codon:yes stop_codon:yes gene_type:complete